MIDPDLDKSARLCRRYEELMGMYEVGDRDAKPHLDRLANELRQRGINVDPENPNNVAAGKWLHEYWQKIETLPRANEPKEFRKCPICLYYPKKKHRSMPVMLQRCMVCGTVFCDDRCSSQECPDPKCRAITMEVDHGIIHPR